MVTMNIAIHQHVQSTLIATVICWNRLMMKTRRYRLRMLGLLAVIVRLNIRLATTSDFVGRVRSQH